MPKCPVCESFQVVIVVAPWPSAWCDGCGARWIQEGSEQRSIMREPVAYAGRVQRVSSPSRGGLGKVTASGLPGLLDAGLAS